MPHQVASDPYKRYDRRENEDPVKMHDYGQDYVDQKFHHD